MPQPAPSSKIILTSTAALKQKYGSTAATRIDKAIAALVAADAKRGITTQLVDLPSGAGAHDVKARIDELDANDTPDYYTLLGSVDVLPHVELDNPVFDDTGNGDVDRTVPSDLPYACDAGYATTPESFIAPTRVVSRMADVAGATDPTDLLGQLRHAATAKSGVRGDYARAFAVTAAVWRQSTTASLNYCLGSAVGLNVSPPQGPSWRPSQLASRVHFINCHGAAADPQFYGDNGRSQPIALKQTGLVGKTAAGTIIAAECCYGAELYNASQFQSDPPIANRYMMQQAHAYLGSTNIAYGPATGMANADVICAEFIRRILAGSSVGRAMLEARQSLIGRSLSLDPIDLKTIAQFIVLGDSSLHPVAPDKPKGKSGTKAESKFMAASGLGTNDRSQRRALLRARGEQLAERVSTPKASRNALPGIEASRVLQEAQKTFKLPNSVIKNFSVLSSQPSQPASLAKIVKDVLGKLDEIAPSRFHVLLGRPSFGKKAKSARTPIVGVVVGEAGDRVVSVRDVMARG